MKLISTILLMFCGKSYATNYYVSNSGSNAANGLTQGTAWQTISKVNSSSFSAGDSILFKCGDSWNEQLIVPSSGSAGNPIVFGSYSTGVKPLITGFQTLSSPSVAGNIYTYTFSNSVTYQNTVMVNGSLRAKGRYPNYGYLTFSSHSGKNQITGSLTGTPDYTGAEVVIRTNDYTIDKGFISSQSAGTINFYPATYYNLTNGYGYFIQNIASALDTLNEWSFDSSSKAVKVYANTTPTVKASSIDTLIKLSGGNYITFYGLQFEGANLAAFSVDSSNYITISNCDINNCGGNGISGKKSNYFTASNNTIDSCWNDGIILFDFATANADSDYPTVSGNSITNIGTVAGMNKGGFHTNVALQLFGDHQTINNNSITNIGYIGIYFYGDTCVVKNNYVDTICYVKDDGGGIYTFSGLSAPKRGSIIRSNIIKNGLSAIPGTTRSGVYSTHGIYADNETQYLLIDSNTVYYQSQSGIFVHESHYITIKNNTLDSNLIALSISNAVDGHSTAHVNFKYNKILSQAVDKIYYALMSVVEQNFDSMDYNAYVNLFDTNKIVRNNIYYNLSAWQDSTGFDLNSTRKPTGTTTATPIISYNPASSIKTIYMNGTYKDILGNTYINLQQIQPFQSSILFKATSNILTGQKLGAFKFQ